LKRSSDNPIKRKKIVVSGQLLEGLLLTADN